MELEQRIVDLEARLAFQDDTIQTLSDVMFAQAQAVERLQAQLELLARRQEDMQGRLGAEDDEAPPPHY
ncbi:MULTISPECIES: SlyX family protein [Pseudomonadaceae]|uniref:Protein SlyX homolog n=1 Tax=Pseudomonas knackmussii TaxID=65741 RepID=A0ABY4KTC0_9PSED|nr:MULTISPECIES: SlyX family protein [Pseudomonas]UPQ84126.1 SlyX family protein [Pseudomonas knackmussii]